jgi:antitoxin component YwqK of YwqJK toxin-antitoxin module
MFKVKFFAMKCIIVCFLFFQSIFAQEMNRLDENGLKHGTWKGVYEESKRPRYEGTFNHGKEIGMFKFFDDTKAKTVIATREFNANENSCYTIFYNQKSNKVSEGKVVNKLFEGEWKYYHEDSPLIMTNEFYSKGKLEGVRKVFYKSEKIAEETSYKNGKKDGPYKSYAENGVVLEETTYLNGEYDGPAIFRNTENGIVGKGLFKNGKKTGIWEFTTNGKTTKQNMNKQGKKFEKRKITREE